MRNWSAASRESRKLLCNPAQGEIVAWLTTDPSPHSPLVRRAAGATVRDTMAAVRACERSLDGFPSSINRETRMLYDTLGYFWGG